MALSEKSGDNNWSVKCLQNEMSFFNLSVEAAIQSLSFSFLMSATVSHGSDALLQVRGQILSEPRLFVTLTSKLM